MLTDTGREESPSFSPNGRWVMYSTQAGGGEYLMAVTTDGRIRQRLTSSSGDIREPAWGPYPEVTRRPDRTADTFRTDPTTAH